MGLYFGICIFNNILDYNLLECRYENQAWAIDITYIPMAKGFLYLAIIDWYSRKVLSWRLSNTMDTSFCIEALEDALKHHYGEA